MTLTEPFVSIFSFKQKEEIQMTLDDAIRLIQVGLKIWKLFDALSIWNNWWRSYICCMLGSWTSKARETSSKIYEGNQVLDKVLKPQLILL